MDQLTPLERELLRSVSELQTGAEAEAAELKSFLKRYLDEREQETSIRLTELEKSLVALAKRQNSIENSNRLEWEKLNSRLDQLNAELQKSTDQLKEYVSDMSLLLKRL
ncbi:hypothetical protein ACVNHC_24385 [Pannonibacter sp. Q-1]